MYLDLNSIIFKKKRDVKVYKFLEVLAVLQGKVDLIKLQLLTTNMQIMRSLHTKDKRGTKVGTALLRVQIIN